jgi:hypothetical protein
MNRSPKIGVGIHALPEEPAEVLEDALRAPSYLRHVQRGEGARGRRDVARVEVCVRGEFQGLGVLLGLVKKDRSKGRNAERCGVAKGRECASEQWRTTPKHRRRYRRKSSRAASASSLRC